MIVDREAFPVRPRPTFSLPGGGAALHRSFPHFHKPVPADYWFFYRDIQVYVPPECRRNAPTMPGNRVESALRMPNRTGISTSTMQHDERYGRKLPFFPS